MVNDELFPKVSPEIAQGMLLSIPYYYILLISLKSLKF